MGCPHCGADLEKLGMSHFSFNKPEGACEACGGLGSVATINEAAVFNPELSMKEGSSFSEWRSSGYTDADISSGGKTFRICV